MIVERAVLYQGGEVAREVFSRCDKGKCSEAKSVFAYVKGIACASNVLSTRSKDEAREGKSESSGEQLQLEKKKGQSMDSSFEDPPLTPRRRENLKYPLNNPDSPPIDAHSGRNDSCGTRRWKSNAEKRQSCSFSAPKVIEIKIG